MNENDEKKFNIQLAAQLSGLSAHTIRAWEKRYQALTPSRTPNGRRLYSSIEVDRLIMLAQSTHLGCSISQIAHLSDADLKTTYNKLVLNNGLLPTVTLPEEKINISDIQKDLIAAVEKYKVDVVSQLLSQAKNAVTPKVFALQILAPLISEVNLRGDEQKMQNAQLQALYALAKFHAGNIIYSHFEKNIKSSQRFVLTTIENENHSFSLLFSALLCCHHKKHFYYLNSNLPATSIIDATKATEATVLILSIPSGRKIQIDAMTILDEVIENLSPKVAIWLVGDLDQTKSNINRWKNTRHIKNQNELDEILENF